MKKKVVMGFLGTQLDSGLGSGRWEKWRPTVSIAQHEDLVVDRLELMHDARNKPLAERVRDDVVQLSPGTEVRLVEMNLANPWDFGEVYGALYDWMGAYAFDTEREEYWAHITTGTHVAQICLFLLVEARFIPGVLLQTAPPRGRQGQGTGSYELIDLDLSRYDAINARLAVAQEDAVSFLKSGIATRNPRFNAMIEEIERIAVQSKAPILLTGPTGAGKSMLARRIFELKKSRHQVGGGFVDVNCATLHGATARLPRCSATKKALSPVRPATAPACCAPPTRAYCFSTRSASWAWTSRPCCSRPSRKNASCPWAPTRRSTAASS
jgi:transcriptional regulatory protein RtcR